MFVSDSDELHAHSTPACHLLLKMISYEIEEKCPPKSNKNRCSVFVLALDRLEIAYQYFESFYSTILTK